MKQRHLPIYLALWFFTGGCTMASVQISETPDFTSISLEKPVHFLDPDGADVLAPAGSYQLEAREETQLRLVPVDETAEKKELIIQALAMPHEQPLAS